LRRADHTAELGEDRLLGQLHTDGLRDPEVDDLHDWFAVVRRDHDIGRLEIAVDDALLVGVLHRRAHVGEECEPRLRIEIFVSTVFGERNALHQLHHEVGPPAFGGSGIMDLRDVGVIHHGEGLPLGLEARADLLGVHPGLDDLQGDPAFYRFGLLSHVDRAEAPFANLLEQLVTPDPIAFLFARDLLRGLNGESRHEVLRREVGGEERFDLLSLWFIVSTDFLQISSAFLRIDDFDGFLKNDVRGGFLFHGWSMVVQEAIRKRVSLAYA
jgi:hypothetical protein